MDGGFVEVVADARKPKVIDMFRAAAAALVALGHPAKAIDFSPNAYCALKFVVE